jgi:hypothetical protein
MDVSEHLQRELVYHLNAALLRPRPLDAAGLTETFVATLQREGPRFHEPDLLDAWAEAAGTDPQSLVEALEEAIDLILEELDDQEGAWSAHRVLDLLAEEPFWVLSWGLPGEDGPRPPLAPARGVPLPFHARPVMVAILDRLELRLFEAQQSQRSVEDALPEAFIEEALDEAMVALHRLGGGRSGKRSAPLPAALARSEALVPSLRDALLTIQHWKLAVAFDAAPDDDDGEWTLRVLERLYGIEWVAQRGPEGGEGRGRAS